MSGSGITGDYAELDALIGRLDTAANAVTRALVVAAPKIQTAARAGYAAGKGPDGVKWPPNKDGTAPSLARPAAAVTWRADGNDLVGEGEDVLAYHQKGSATLPRRPVFPEPGTLPPAWTDLVEDALRVELGEKP